MDKTYLKTDLTPRICFDRISETSGETNVPGSAELLQVLQHAGGNAEIYFISGVSEPNARHPV